MIARRESIGERVVERQILAGVVAHREGQILSSLCNQPLVIKSTVASIHLVGPRVRQSTNPRDVGPLHVQPKRRVSPPLRIRLEPKLMSVRLHMRTLIPKSPNAFERTKGVIEGSVLLHQNDDMLGIHKRRPMLRIDAKRPGDRLRYCAP